MNAIYPLLWAMMMMLCTPTFAVKCEKRSRAFISDYSIPFDRALAPWVSVAQQRMLIKMGYELLLENQSFQLKRKNKILLEISLLGIRAIRFAPEPRWLFEARYVDVFIRTESEIRMTRLTRDGQAIQRGALAMPGPSFGFFFLQHRTYRDDPKRKAKVIAKQPMLVDVSASRVTLYNADLKLFHLEPRSFNLEGIATAAELTHTYRRTGSGRISERRYPMLLLAEGDVLNAWELHADRMVKVSTLKLADQVAHIQLAWQHDLERDYPTRVPGIIPIHATAFFNLRFARADFTEDSGFYIVKRNKFGTITGVGFGQEPVKE